MFFLDLTPAWVIGYYIMNTTLIDKLIDILFPLLAAIAALLVGALMLILLGVNPIEGYGALIQGAFGSKNALADTIVKATPLLLVGLGICIAFRAGVINIGGEGQMITGALSATAVGLALADSPPALVIPLALIVGFIGGAIWGGIAGFLKARFNVNEILSTIMMNAIAVQIMNLLLRGPMIDKNQMGAAAIPQTVRLPRDFDLPRSISCLYFTLAHFSGLPHTCSWKECFCISLRWYVYQTNNCQFHDA